MNPEPPNWEPPPAPPEPLPNRPRGRLRLLGVAVAIAVIGAAAGFVVTRASSVTPANTTAAKATPSSGPALRPPSFGRGGFGAPCASGFASAGFGLAGGGFCGGATGTVTKISGSTITLRTLAGTATVTTSSSTKYTREGKQVSFAAIKVGEVLQVRAMRGATSKTATSPIAATAITVEIPTVTGRVQSVSGNTITLVTGDGQLEYATTSTATVYQGLRGATATSASVKAGIYVVVQGTETDLTHITADGIQVLGSATFTPHNFPNHPRGDASPKPSPATGSSV
ncbi:MAG TPA: DUF5666 domain-containing protein [Candidatus Dormibacteraeota bacterium]